ncbi:uncharacterized protein LOC111384982 [Olea europaea var. sylvestris]|uniref:uncharacterized protein LOC111384982 n=1 Tax=Olea europaea var. sylvestris TaxID=158386 RepID=UPI000C1D7B3A|nr:uncharacterized protein LOC111384982 [Olea europaea var. sylvestris]
MTILEKKRVQILLIVGVIALSITAEKCRNLVGEEAASKSGKFTFLNCLDGGTGTLACVVKEGVKLYFYNIRSIHVESARNKAIESALSDAITQGMPANDAAKLAQKEGAKAAKLATRKAKRIIGPIISSGWDFFEALYYGGTITEGFLRGTGTLFGAYSVGFIGEQRFGRFGYLVGSHLGSWVGGRIGLMLYDVVNGVKYMLQFFQLDEPKVYDDASTEQVLESTGFETSDGSEDSFDNASSEQVSESTGFETPDVSEDSYINEMPTHTSDESNESPDDAREEF